MPLNVIATLLEKTSKQNTKQTNKMGKEREGKNKKRKKGSKSDQRRNRGKVQNEWNKRKILSVELETEWDKIGELELRIHV